MHHEVIVIFCVLVVNTFCQVSTELSDEVDDDHDDIVEGRDVEDDVALSEIAGVKGVWWPGTHAISSWWSLLAATLSSVAIGAAVVPAVRRSDMVEDRVSWPAHPVNMIHLERKCRRSCKLKY